MTTIPIISMNGLPVIKALNQVVDSLAREIKIINSKTATKTSSLIAKEITTELAVSQRVVKSNIVIKKNEDRSVEVRLFKTARLPIKRFNPRQTKQGVSYKISKKNGRTTVAGAFMGPKPGLTFVRFRGHVMVRVGIARLPIKKLYGPSPWAVHVKNNQVEQVVPKIRQEQRRQMNERLRYQTLKQSGAI